MLTKEDIFNAVFDSAIAFAGLHFIVKMFLEIVDKPYSGLVVIIVGLIYIGIVKVIYGGGIKC